MQERYPHNRTYAPSSARGVALIIVLFVMALGSILVINLASSTSLSAHRISYAQRAIEAEYLLKSAMNVARGLIGAQGSSSNADSPKSPWGTFAMGAPLPEGLIPDLSFGENVDLFLEVRPEDTKIPLKQIYSGTAIDPFWRDTITNLMTNLGFDTDGEVDQTGRFPNRAIRVSELVGLLIDYLDNDTNSTETSLGESDLPKNLFPGNREIHRLEDLATLPGFTQRRLQLLEPYVTVANTTKININLAPREVLNAFPNVPPGEVDAIINFRESPSGPFTSFRYSTDVPAIAPSFDSVRMSKIDPVSNYFDIIAKADYGTSAYFLKAIVTRSGNVPNVVSMELY